MPPASITPAIVKSMARLRHCASAPDMEEAVMWLRVVATATVDGMPVKTSSGVMQEAAADAEHAGQKTHAETHAQTMISH